MEGGDPGPHLCLTVKELWGQHPDPICWHLEEVAKCLPLCISVLLCVCIFSFVKVIKALGVVRVCGSGSMRGRGSMMYMQVCRG